jgi:hypothetical protein
MRLQSEAETKDRRLLHNPVVPRRQSREGAEKSTAGLEGYGFQGCRLAIHRVSGFGRRGQLEPCPDTKHEFFPQAVQPVMVGNQGRNKFVISTEAKRSGEICGFRMLY